MLHPRFNEEAVPGFLSFLIDSLDKKAPIEVQLEEADRRILIDLEIEPAVLMRALMGRGSMPCRYILLPPVAAMTDDDVEAARLAHHLAVDGGAYDLSDCNDSVIFALATAGIALAKKIAREPLGYGLETVDGVTGVFPYFRKEDVTGPDNYFPERAVALAAANDLNLPGATR